MASYSAASNKRGGAILTGSPLPTMLIFAFPIILGNIFQQLYNIVDAVVVGKFLGNLPLSGISVAAPMMDIVNALIIGATIGVGVLTAQLCGAEDWKRLKVVHSTALIGGAALVLVISGVCILFGESILRAQGTEEAVCREAMKYLRIIFGGMIFCFLYNYYGTMLRSYGNSRMPFVILLVSSTLHAALDVLLVGVLKMGIQGVAVSTVICQMFSACWCMCYVHRRCPALALEHSELVFRPAVGKTVVSFAWAAAIQQAVIYIGRFLVQGMLSQLGTNTVTGYNMGMRTESFLLCLGQGLSAGVLVCLSQNIGHGNYRRVLRFYRLGAISEFLLALTLGCICMGFAENLIGLFSDHAEVIAAGSLYIRSMAFFYILGFSGEIIQCFFWGLGRLRLTMLASLGQVVLRVILSWLLIPRLGIPGICAAVVSGWFLLVVLEGSYSIHVARQLKKQAAAN